MQLTVSMPWVISVLSSPSITVQALAMGWARMKARSGAEASKREPRADVGAGGRQQMIGREMESVRELAFGGAEELDG